MASYTPPTEKLPIFDNSVFTASNSSVLTVATANLLYLRKSYPDTATAVETFNAGIKTNSIMQRSNATLFFGDDINPISFLSPNILMGDFGGTVSITPSILNLGDGIANINIGGTTNSGSGSIVIGGTSLGGTIQIGNAIGTAPSIQVIGTTLMNGQITINSTGTNPTNIGTGTTTGPVGIGNTANTTTISGIVKMPNLGTNNYIFRQPSSSQSIPVSTDTTILFTTLISSANNVGITYNTGTGVFTNSNSYSITCQIAYTVGFQQSGVGNRNARINSSAYNAVAYIYALPPSTSECLLSSSTVLVIPASGTFNISCYQSTASPLGLDNNVTSIQILVL